MMLKITSFNDTHLEDAAVLVSRRFTQLRKQEPLLPARYANVSEVRLLLNNILAKSGHGVAAFRGGRFVGFLMGWLLPSFRGQRSTFSPEWANAADPSESQYIYEEMYSYVAEKWVAEGYSAHYISIFPNDNEAIRACHWMGFGMVAVDAIRCLENIPGIRDDIDIYLAGRQDLDEVMALDKALWRHMKETPCFLLSERKDRNHYEEWIRNPKKSVWLAYLDAEPMAFLSLGPANEDTCTIIVDEKTTSIYGAFTMKNMRGSGIATALLNHALEFARVAEYERCAVDFEPMNLAGSRFWLKHFKPVCLSLFRQIDLRVIDS